VALFAFGDAPLARGHMTLGQDRSGAGDGARLWSARQET